MKEVIGGRKNRLIFKPILFSTPSFKRKNKFKASIIDSIPSGFVKKNIAMFNNTNPNGPVVPQPMGQSLPAVPFGQVLPVSTQQVGLSTPFSPQQFSHNDVVFEQNSMQIGGQNFVPPGFMQQHPGPPNLNGSFFPNPMPGHNTSLPLSFNHQQVPPQGSLSESDKIFKYFDEKYEALHREIKEIQNLRADLNSIVSDVQLLKNRSQLDIKKVAESLHDSVTQTILNKLSNNIGEEIGLNSIKGDIEKLSQYRSEMFDDNLRKNIILSNNRVIIFGRSNMESSDLKDYLKRILKSDKMKLLTDCLTYNRVGKKRDHLLTFDSLKSRQEFLRDLDNSKIEKGVRIERDIPLEFRDYYQKFKTRSRMIKAALGINSVIHFRDCNMVLLATSNDSISDRNSNSRSIIWSFKPIPVPRELLRDRGTKAEVINSSDMIANDKFINLPIPNQSDVMNRLLFWRPKDTSLTADKARELLIGACSKEFKRAINYVTKDKGLFAITLSNDFELESVRTDLQAKIIGGDTVRLLFWLDC